MAALLGIIAGGADVCYCGSSKPRVDRNCKNFEGATPLKPISQLRFDYDTTAISAIRRYHDTFDYDESDRNYDMLRFDCNTTTIRLH